MARPLRYIFPCTGHSGSKFVSELITGAGVPCGHEKLYNTFTIYNDDDELRRGTPAGALITCDWVHNIDKYDAESSFAAAPFLSDPLCREAQCVHVVRRPISVVSSWYYENGIFGFPYFDLWLKTGVGLRTPEACVTMYVLWNSLIARERPDSTMCRVEDAQDILDVCRLEGDIPPPSNKHRDKPDLSFDDIESPQRELLERITEVYGYN